MHKIQRHKNRVARVGLLLVSLVLMHFANVSAAFAASAPEEKIRAAFVLGVVRFTQWPNFIPSHERPINICVYGTSIAGEIIKSQDKDSLLQKKIAVVEPGSVDECHVAIVGSDANPNLIQQLKGKPVLTICDDCERDELTSVRLIRKNRRVGLEVNLSQTDEAGLKMSAQLLEVAQVVRD